MPRKRKNTQPPSPVIEQSEEIAPVMSAAEAGSYVRPEFVEEPKTLIGDLTIDNEPVVDMTQSEDPTLDHDVIEDFEIEDFEFDAGDVDHVLSDAALEEIAELDDDVTNDPSYPVKIDDNSESLKEAIEELEAVMSEAQALTEAFKGDVENYEAPEQSEEIDAKPEEQPETPHFVDETPAADLNEGFGLDLTPVDVEVNVDEPEEIVSEDPEIAELEAAVAQIEAHEEQPEIEVEVASFDDVKDGVSEDEALIKAKEMSHVITRREAFEQNKNPDNNTIFATLKKARRQLVGIDEGRILVAAGVDVEELLREKHTGSLYNVYAYTKLGDIVKALANNGQISNAINIACMKSLFRFRHLKIPFDKKTAEAAASKHVHVDAAIARHLVRHSVAAITAPTQASSTMQALATLGVVSVQGNRNPVYTVLNTPIARKLEEMLLAA